MEGERQKSPFHRLRRHQALIGRRTAIALGMVTLHTCLTTANKSDLNQITGKAHLTKAELASRFPKLFSGKLGCVKDIEVKLEVDESIKPVKQPLRPIAFHYRDAVESELDKQVAEGILEGNYINAIAAANIPRLVTMDEVRDTTSADSEL